MEQKKKIKRKFGKRKSDYIIRYLLMASFIILLVETVALLVQ